VLHPPVSHIGRGRKSEARLARPDCAGDGRRAGHGDDHAHRWRQQDGRLALQERFMLEGVDGLLRDKTRPARIARLTDDVAERIVALTLGEPPGPWTAPSRACP